MPLLCCSRLSGIGLQCSSFMLMSCHIPIILVASTHYPNEQILTTHQQPINNPSTTHQQTITTTQHNTANNTTTQHNNTTQQHNTTTQQHNTTQPTTQQHNTTTQHNNTTQQHNNTTQHHNTTPQHNTTTPNTKHQTPNTKHDQTMARAKQSQRRTATGAKTPKNQSATQAMRSAKLFRKQQLQQLKKSTTWAGLHTPDKSHAILKLVVDIFRQFPPMERVSDPVMQDKLQRQHTKNAKKNEKRAPKRAHAWMVHNWSTMDSNKL